jgi:hypothetical protein
MGGKIDGDGGHLMHRSGICPNGQRWLPNISSDLAQTHEWAKQFRRSSASRDEPPITFRGGGVPTGDIAADAAR